MQVNRTPLPGDEQTRFRQLTRDTRGTRARLARLARRGGALASELVELAVAYRFPLPDDLVRVAQQLGLPRRVGPGARRGPRSLRPARHPGEAIMPAPEGGEAA